MALKLCSKCGRDLDQDKFKLVKIGSWEGYDPACRQCRRLWNRFTITFAQFLTLKAMFLVCPICEKREPNVIDHDWDHCFGRKSCGKCIRGYVCRPCNANLGGWQEGSKRMINSHLVPSFKRYLAKGYVSL